MRLRLRDVSVMSAAQSVRQLVSSLWLLILENSTQRDNPKPSSCTSSRPSKPEETGDRDLGYFNEPWVYGK